MSGLFLTAKDRRERKEGILARIHHRFGCLSDALAQWISESGVIYHRFSRDSSSERPQSSVRSGMFIETGVEERRSSVGAACPIVVPASVVAQVSNLLYRSDSGLRTVRMFLGVLVFRPPADWKSAIQQVGNLRYGWCGSAALCSLRCFAVILLLLALPVRGSELAGGEAVECANLIYAGTKSSVCFSEEFLSAVASETSINTARKFKPVKLAEKEAFRFPFAVMTGEGGFTLTDDERKNLKLYLEKGGFLLASAGCSSREWSDSFRREIEAIFPDRKLSDVPMAHPVFRTIFEVQRLDMSHGGEAKLQGLTIGGKIVVIFSSDGLNDTGTMHGCCCCGGNEIKNSQKVNANILAYALLQ